MTSKSNDDDEEKDELDRKHEIVWMMDPDTHTCGQDIVESNVDVIVTKFKANILREIKENVKARYNQIYEVKKKALLRAVEDEDLKERVRYSLPAAVSLRASAHRARQRGVPPGLCSLAESDLSLLSSSYLVGENRELKVWVFGSKELAREFCDSNYKSSDGTFKIAPRLSYQGSNVLHVNCMSCE